MQCKLVEQSERGLCQNDSFVIREEGGGGAQEVKVDRNWEIGRHQGTEAG